MSVSNEPQQQPSRVAIRDGLLTTPLDDLSKVHLQGSRCSNCGETTIGKNTVCPNCGRDTVSTLPLSTRGTVWTYTVVRHKPPGNYKGPDPFVPFAMGLVELAEGVRVLSPIDCPIEKLKIGLPVEFRASVRPGSTQPEVVTFTFVPAA